MDHGTWIVDSGAELMIAGSFIYPYSRVLQRFPPIRIKGVDGELTQVDAVVRRFKFTVATLKLCSQLLASNLQIFFR